MSMYAIEDMLQGFRQGALGMPLPHLTDKQVQCLFFIGECYLKHWSYPTRREIAKQMGLNSCSADSYVKPLEKKGYLSIDKRIDKKNGRNIRLTRAAFLKLTQLGMDLKAVQIDEHDLDPYAALVKTIGA